MIFKFLNYFLNRGLFYIASILVSFFLLFSCGSKDEEEEELYQSLQFSQGNVSSWEGENLTENGLWLGILTFQPLVVLPEYYEILTGIEFNIGRSANTDQALIVKDNNQQGKIYILILGYKINTKDPDILYKHLLPIEVETSIILKLEDLVGDFEKEILIEGNKENGEKSFIILKSNPKVLDTYLPIFERTLRGTFTILTRDRSLSYEQGKAFGVSFGIKAEYEALEKNGTLKEFEEIYDWNNSHFEYRLTEKKENSQDLNQQFLSFLKRGKEGIMEILSGPWFKNEVSQETSFFFFDARNQRIQFYNQGRQEIFNWDYLGLPSIQTVSITAHNELVEMIRNNFRIQVLDLNKIYISSDADEAMELSGTYYRMSHSVQETIFDALGNSMAPQKQNIKYPEGIYIGEKEARLEFNYPKVIWRQGDLIREGFFDIFFFKDQPILQWQFDLNGEPESFSLSYIKKDKDPSSKESLILKEVNLSFNKLYFSDFPLTLRFDPVNF